MTTISVPMLTGGRSLAVNYGQRGTDVWKMMASTTPGKVGRLFVLDSNDGPPDESATNEFLMQLMTVHHYGGLAIGYVKVNQPGQAPWPVNTIIADIDAWYAFGPVDGIFLDNCSFSAPVPPTALTTAQALYKHIKTKPGMKLVMGNVGWWPQQQFMTGCLDIFNVFEDDLPSLNDNWKRQRPSWLGDSHHFTAFVGNVPQPQIVNTVNMLRNLGVGWQYLAEETIQSSYGTPPTQAYWKALATATA